MAGQQAQQMAGQMANQQAQQMAGQMAAQQAGQMAADMLGNKHNNGASDGWSASTAHGASKLVKHNTWRIRWLEQAQWRTNGGEQAQTWQQMNK